jgi:hypothetical protein
MANTYEDKKQEALYNYENGVRNAIDESNKTYDSMIAQSDNAHKDQINSLEAQKNNTDPMSQAVKEQTDFAIKQIEQQKDQAKEDYTKEQSAAYVDWQKQINPYGANAEQMASMGMSNTGYSETSKVMMYTAYQNRVAVARESYNTAVQNYNNAMTEARMQNNSALAQIAADALAKQLELSLQMVQRRNDLLTEKAKQSLKIDVENYSRYQDVLNQLYEEEALRQQNSGTLFTGNNGTQFTQPGYDFTNPNDTQAVIKGDDEIEPGTVIEEISNKTRNGFVEIPGHGWFTYTQLLALVNSGQVKETMENGKRKYTWVYKGTNTKNIPSTLSKNVSK